MSDSKKKKEAHNNRQSPSAGWDIVDKSTQNRLDAIDEKIVSLEKQMEIITQKLDRVVDIAMENRKIYMDYITQNHHVTKKVVEILEENRKMYMQAFNQVESKEDTTIREIKPILEDINQQNKVLRENIESPHLLDRIANYYWRNAHTTAVPYHLLFRTNANTSTTVNQNTIE